MKFVRVLPLIALLAATATASYHFVRYSSRFGYQQPIYEKFDLNALINKTVPFFIVSDAQERLAPGDNSNALMSQILLAAKTWGDVSTSELRLAFGGYAPIASAPQSAPGIDVIFSEDVPPGVISYAGPTVKAEADLNANAPFTPILRSLVVFRKDLTNVDGVAYPSYSEAFFLNAVHEFGHALGLQHTFTSSAMSTQLTRATTRSKPLVADDVAAISILYPSLNFTSLFGTVSGRVTQNGVGVNLASVVVLSLNGKAVSTLSNPDGTYRIQGVPPGPYQVYVHPIPPPVRGQTTPGDIMLPRDPDNNLIPVNNRFDLQFFPGTRDPQAAQTFNVLAGQTLPDINFTVNTRSSAPTLFYPTTYSYFTNPATNSGNYVRPAFITPQVVNPGFIASGFGFVTSDSKPVAGLRSSILGGSPAINGVRGFSNQFIVFDLFLSGFLSEGERHMVLDNGTESYVLPSAIQVATRRAPEVINVNWIAAAADGTRLALVTASGINSRTRVLVDGEEVTVRSLDEAGGTLTISVPNAPTGHVARIVLLSEDGQSSLFLRPDAPAQLPFTEAEVSGFSISPSTITQGSESVIEINSPGAHFLPGRVSVGFGSSDVQARAISVVSPSRILVSVVAAASAPTGTFNVTVQTGLNHLQSRNALNLQPSAAIFQKPALQPDSRWTSESGSSLVLPGSNAVVQIAGLTAANPKLSASLNDTPANILGAGNGRILLQVPATLNYGWALLKISVEGETVNSILVPVSGASPSIQRIEGADQFLIDTNRPAYAGDNFTLTFIDPAQGPDSTLRANEVAIAIGETPVYTLRVTRTGDLFQAIFNAPKGLADGTYQLNLNINGRISSSVPLLLRNR